MRMKRLTLPTLKSLFAVALVTVATGCLKTEFNFPSVAVATPQSCTVSDANLVAGNIRSGITIFGVMGSYTPSYSETDFVSAMHRSKGYAQISWLQDVAATTPFVVSATGYTAIPSFTTDHDEDLLTTVDRVDRTGWAARTCGTTGALTARIDDCADEFGANATWDGSAAGTSGEAVWKLVSRTGANVSSRGREVWQDQRTKMVWSSLVSNTANWCIATGKNNITGNPVAEADPDNMCENPIKQNDTASGLPAISACYEDGGVLFTDVDNITSPNSIDPAGKAGLGFSSTPSVKWRLPTRNDYYQAEIDGIRFVMPDMLDLNNWEWTTTISTLPTNEAYGFHSDTAETSLRARWNGDSVRCVGH